MLAATSTVLSECILLHVGTVPVNPCFSGTTHIKIYVSLIMAPTVFSKYLGIFLYNILELKFSLNKQINEHKPNYNLIR